MIKNAKVLPKVYFGLHMCEGVAEYAEPGRDPYRIFIGEECIKNMDPSFKGKPLYVEHVDEVDLDNLQLEADGYVIRSFFNQADGKHWAEFIVVSDRGHQAIQNGWKLSNAYVPKQLTGGGLWHGVEYSKQVMNGEYEHLAIVRNPRYEESIILTPDEFKEYCQGKEAELLKLANSKKEKVETMGLSFFKKQKVENAVDLESTGVVLPKSKKEMTISQLVNAMDEHEMKENEGMADMAHKVKLHDGSVCNVGELLEKHKAMHDEMSEMKKKMDSSESEHDLETADKEVDVEGDLANDDEMDGGAENESDEDAKKKALELAEHEEKEIEEAKKKSNAAAKAKAKENFEKLKNAETKARVQNEARIDLPEDQVARGKARYGAK